MKPSRWLATLPCALALHVFAQTVKPLPVIVPPPPAPPTYTAESAVLLHRDNIYREAADGTGTVQTTVTVRVQSEAALKELSVVSIAFASNSQHVDFAYVRVRHSDGTLSETPTKDTIEVASPVTQQAPFYSDLKMLQLPVRTLRVGDTLEWQATVVRTKAEAPNQFWGQGTFATDLVVLSETLELHVPKNSYVNVWSPAYKPVETSTDTEHVFRWEHTQLKPLVGPAADAEREAKKKQVWTADQELDSREGKLPDVAWTTFKSWDEVGSWYRGLELERTVPDAGIKAKVAQLTAGKETEEAKVRAVYGFVSSQIRYIGVAFGIGRYQPHAASNVLENQYGDCKDKHTLLAAMLTSLGLHPEAALIGSGIRFNQAVPSPESFNHLITRVQVDGQPVWLDSTAEVAPYRMLMYGIRDHDALVIPETGSAQVLKTPVDPPFPVFQKMEAAGTLDPQGVSTSRLTLTMRGDDELIIRSVLRQVAPAQYDQFAQQLCQGMGYVGTASHAEFSNQDDTTRPLVISFDYKREKAGDWPNHRIIPQLAPVILLRPDTANPPVQTISLGVKRVETSTSSMKLPDGWGAELPEAVHQKSVYATYDETYRIEKGTLYATRSIEVLKEKVPVAEWKAYNKWAEAVDLGDEQYVQLTHTGAAPSASSSEESTSKSEGDLSSLMAEAFKSMQSNDLTRARTVLDQVKAARPTYPHLWSAFGYLELRSGETTKAIEDCKKELELHPDDVSTYNLLLQLLTMTNQDQETEKMLAKWSAADPTNSGPPTRLMELYLKNGDSAKAAKTGEAALKLLPEDSRKDETFQYELGKAQLGAGKTQEGTATLVALLESTQNPGMLNNGAYELGNANVELPLAEKSIRAAISKEEEESRSWTSDENPQILAGKTSNMEAAWDTLGWILFREGHADEAETYIRASWNLRQSTEVGQHLGDIARARGDKDAALTDYQLAQATVFGYDGLGVRRAPTESEKKLSTLIETLRKEGAHSAIGDPNTALQQLRKYPLGRPHGWLGTAEYRLLLSGGGIEKATATGANDPLLERASLVQLKLPGLWPPGSQAKLVRTAMLNCHSNVCELILEP